MQFAWENSKPPEKSSKPDETKPKSMNEPTEKSSKPDEIKPKSMNEAKRIAGGADPKQF